MSIPSPATVMRRRPAGTPGRAGGQFSEKVNDAPAGALALPQTVFSPDELPGADVETIPDWVAAEDEALATEYRDLWKRVNAKHRSTTYGTAPTLSQSSEDPAELAVLAQLQAPGIAVNVARNPHTPAAVLHMLAVGRSDWRDPEARREAVLHPNCPEATIRMVWAHRNAIGHQGIAKTAILAAPNTPDDIRQQAEEEAAAAKAEQ